MQLQSERETSEQDVRVLELARQLALELHRQRRSTRGLSLDSSLTRDFGFDSLSRAELFLRIERELGVSLPEQLLASAETVRDLLPALRAPAARAQPRASEPALPSVSAEAAEPLPHAARSLLEVLRFHVAAHPDRIHVQLDAGGELQPLTYAALHEGAERAARGLLARGVLAGDAVAVMLPTGIDYLQMFLGVLASGAVPVPLYPPAQPSHIEDHLRRQVGILANAQARWLITSHDVQRVGALLSLLVPGLNVTTPEALQAASAEPPSQALPAESSPPAPDGVALLQYTSGSTGDPKGVILTNANLLANVRAMGEAVQASPADVLVSWLPLYHDMGLIGAWLGCLYYGCPLVLMSPLRFLAGPSRWLWAIHRHRATISAAPNFAYELCASKVDDGELKGLDLSSWRVALNGAEPVSPVTLRKFCAHFAQHGFRADAMSPVYGLAECSVGLAFPPLGRGPRIDRIERVTFMREGHAVPTSPDDPHALEFVACGRPLSDHEIRIVDESSHELPEREQGRLQFRGPSATRGYLNNPSQTARLFDHGWLESGDLAYAAAGDIYVTGRSKDIIVRGGRNIHPHEVEDAVGRIPGVRKGCVAVFGIAEAASGTERIVLAAETREADAEARERLRESITKTSSELLGMEPEEVLLVAPRSIPKTTSGKIRRAACRDAYAHGELGRAPRAVSWQLMRLAWFGARSRVWRAWRSGAAHLYAIYAWLLLCLVVPPTWLLIVLLPRFEQRWGVLKRAARTLFVLSGTPLRVQGAGEAVARAGVLVCNHTSYLDGLVLAASLPMPVQFVVKAELAARWFTRLPLDRLRVSYVERADAVQGLADLRRLGEELRPGAPPLLFFPEGTLTRVSGLRAFHMGAFSIAIEAGVPITPLAISGARAMLRGGSWFLRRGRISVQFGPALSPAGSGFAAALHLRDAARTFILEHCGESDLEAISYGARKHDEP